MKITKEELIQILKEWRIVNPELISDGRGEYADVYKLSPENIKSLIEQINEKESIQ